jgi:hypothetical protein
VQGVRRYGIDVERMAAQDGENVEVRERLVIRES